MLLLPTPWPAPAEQSGAEPRQPLYSGYNWYRGLVSLDKDWPGAWVEPGALAAAYSVVGARAVSADTAAPLLQAVARTGSGAGATTA